MQPTLPGFDNRPICPTCKRPASVLGEWWPGSRKFVCQACCHQLSSRMDEVCDINSKNSVGVGLRPEPEYAPLRDLYHMRANMVFELAHGCMYTLADADEHGYLPCMKTDLHLAQANGGLGWKRAVDLSGIRWECKRCRNKLRYLTQVHQQAIHFRSRLRTANLITQAMPICRRCGELHDNQYEHAGGYDTYCQRCNDLNSVETFYRMRAIFGNSDMEEIFDRIQKSHPHLFERGILPDYWFELVLKENKHHE